MSATSALNKNKKNTKYVLIGFADFCKFLPPLRKRCRRQPSLRVYPDYGRLNGIVFRMQCVFQTIIQFRKLGLSASRTATASRHFYFLLGFRMCIIQARRVNIYIYITISEIEPHVLRGKGAGGRPP